VLAGLERPPAAVPWLDLTTADLLDEGRQAPEMVGGVRLDWPSGGQGAVSAGRLSGPRRRPSQLSSELRLDQAAVFRDRLRRQAFRVPHDAHNRFGVMTHTLDHTGPVAHARSGVVVFTAAHLW
jgi:hypothetical protein